MRKQQPNHFGQDFIDILKQHLAGELEPVIDEVKPMSQIQQAHDQLEAGKVTGKLILVPDYLY